MSSTVAQGSGQHAQTQGQIWGNEEQGRSACQGKITKRHLVVLGALAGGAALALGLFIGLSRSNGDSSERAVGQATDPNSLGCYVDERRSRVMENRLTDTSLTWEICQAHCEGYAYYAMQYGEECWCAEEGTDITVNGEGVCDYPCAGDASTICGGYLTFTAYDIDTDASTEVTSETTSSTANTGGASSASNTDGTASTCTGDVATFRYASSSNIQYVESGGCATLTDIYNQQTTDGPLYVLDESDEIVGGTPTGYWLLTSSLFVYDDATLYFHGTADGGDCDVLRIQSDGSDDFHEIRGHGGSLSFYGTKVTSWDTKNGQQQTDYEDGRSFINCVSEVATANADCAKNDLGECRMDIINSEMGDLGWFDAESYGLTWKVRGFCSDLSNPEVFDEVNVYGDIQGSEIYGMYYGMYSYGHSGGVWTNNVMRDNILYGFDPHDDSDDLEIAYNTVYGNGNHGIIASKRCNNVVIHDNEVYDGGDEAAGIFLHRSSDSGLVYNNYVHDMQDAGIAIMESMDGEIYDNVFENVKYGIRISLGGADNYIHDNVFDTCSSYGIYTYEGSDDPDVSDGRPSGNIFENNQVLNSAYGVKINQGDDNVFSGNEFTGTETFEFTDSDGTDWTGNTHESGCYEASSSSFTSGSDLPSEC